MPAPHFPSPPFTRASKLLSLAFLLIVALALFSNITHPRQIDFSSFWAAAVLAIGGHASAAYDIAAHQAVQNHVVAFGNYLPFAYPPPFLILLLPFGLMPYGISACLWVAAGFGLYWAAASRLWPRSGWQIAAFPPVLANCMVGQSGLLTGAIFLAASSQLGKRPFLSGLLFGCLIIKPQLAVLLPLAFLASREWKAFAGAACSAILMLLAALVIFGADSYAALLRGLPEYSGIAFDSELAWHKMVSVYASLRLGGAPAEVAWIIHILIAVSAAIATMIAWRREYGLLQKLAVLAGATALISPYLFAYDLVMLIIPFMYLLCKRRGLALLTVLWCLPLLHLAQSWGFDPPVNLMPLVPLGLLAMILHRRVD